MVYPGYATGDVFGVAAALVLKPDLHVVVTDQTSGDPTVKGADIEAFLKQSLPPDQQFRVKRVMVTSVRRQTTADRNLVAAATAGAKGKVEGVNFGTKFLAKGAYGDTQRTAVRTAWQVNASVDAAIGAWLDHKGYQRRAPAWSFYGRASAARRATSHRARHQLHGHAAARNEAGRRTPS